MADRPLWLIRAAAGLEGHGLTSIFVPTVTDVDHQPLGRTRPCRGTRIHVMEDSAGTIYHEFQRNYDCSTDTNLLVAKRLGSIAAKYVAEPFDETFFAEVEPVAKGAMDDLALRVPATRSAEGCSNQVSFEAPARELSMADHGCSCRRRGSESTLPILSKEGSSKLKRWTSSRKRCVLKSPTLRARSPQSRHLKPPQDADAVAVCAPSGSCATTSISTLISSSPRRGTPTQVQIGR